MHFIVFAWNRIAICMVSKFTLNSFLFFYHLRAWKNMLFKTIWFQIQQSKNFLDFPTGLHKCQEQNEFKEMFFLWSRWQSELQLVLSKMSFYLPRKLSKRFFLVFVLCIFAFVAGFKSFVQALFHKSSEKINNMTASATFCKCEGDTADVIHGAVVKERYEQTTTCGIQAFQRY